jgi:hypothetical protein
VEPVGQEALQPFRRQRNGIGPRDAYDVETLRAGDVVERRLQSRRVG